MVGGILGVFVGGKVGIVGDTDGIFVGEIVGGTDGLFVGGDDGTVGFCVGDLDGGGVGFGVGSSVGLGKVGFVGVAVVGDMDGIFVVGDIGGCVGDIDGANVASLHMFGITVVSM